MLKYIELFEEISYYSKPTKWRGRRLLNTLKNKRYKIR